MSNKNCPLSNIEDVRNVLSAARLGTYEQMLKTVAGKLPDASDVLDLYLWNAKMSSALLFPMHICEVVIRNAVSEAIALVYEENWPWNQAFIRSLAGNERQTLKKGIGKFTAGMTGKVVAAMTFVFWEKMFTARHDDRIWVPNLATALPNLDPELSVPQARERIYASLQAVRNLRNRIAHHEPVFRDATKENYEKIQWLISIRCTKTSAWMDSNQQVSSLLQSCPVDILSMPTKRPTSRKKKL